MFTNCTNWWCRLESLKLFWLACALFCIFVCLWFYAASWETVNTPVTGGGYFGQNWRVACFAPISSYMSLFDCMHACDRL